ncbi:cytochrome C oxidase subunit IV family protein [Halobacteriovorax sp. HLS]|uniref:cytochrome C oxidase subunit IV family protein n=1 Tax=Halobacteriovorax sp. HLS TaxID=2234000 RepID=UPI000FD90CAF|nr:cytochrome C oxidase subunit IV family protein [Halobacteriovorax sp. HLS]
MSETHHHSHKKLYIIIFFALAILTGVELIIPELSVAYSLKASSLVGLALGKAFLVAYFYMHLNEDTKWLKYIAAVPCSAFLYAAVLIAESMFR